jgi:CheY-like chemotaxis protein
MIIDEETDIIKQVKEILEKEDVEIVTATDSRQALGRLKEENEETFDMILVNTRMPGSQNTTALFSMKPTLKKQTSGIENFLPKPYTKEQLIEFVKEKIRID